MFASEWKKLTQDLLGIGNLLEQMGHPTVLKLTLRLQFLSIQILLLQSKISRSTEAP